MKRRLPAKLDLSIRHRMFGALLGGFFALGLLKFGNPIILDAQVGTPTRLIEWVVFPWPVHIAYALLAGILILGARLADWDLRGLPKLAWVPALWLAWQWIAGTHSTERNLSLATLAHFSACTLLFYLGCFGLRSNPRLAGVGAVLLAGFALMLVSGFEQHFGGLEATRRMVYAQPHWQDLPQGYLEKIAKNRIFATLFYPNTLAGAILFLLPPCLQTIWRLCGRLQLPSRVLIASLFALAGLACLYWTESKGGWLIALALFLVVLGHRPFPKVWKFMGLAILLIAGLTAFFTKYHTYFERGATSLTARFDYWHAAWQTAMVYPLVGTGPGTFQIAYRQIKSPEAEMARLVHNDYLEQACDAGWPAFILYGLLVGGSLIHLYRPSRATPLRWWVWVGLLALSLHSLLEFSLYIPALAWPFFTLLGWSIGQQARDADGRKGAK